MMTHLFTAGAQRLSVDNFH